MIDEIKIVIDPSDSQKEKGDFIENILRSIMETQRYKVKQQINFTGTEIDLLCEHMDRPDDKVLVECKAKSTVVSEDIKKFGYDLLAMKIADFGYFVHTSELKHQACGISIDFQEKNPGKAVFWGPSKVIELLLHSGYIIPFEKKIFDNKITPTKRILCLSPYGKSWIIILSAGTIPTHYYISSATSTTIEQVNEKTIISFIDELEGLERYESNKESRVFKYEPAYESVAEVQEALDWDDYLPVGTKYFIGRKDICNEIYQFIIDESLRNVFFIEGKSGWGKSSIIAQLRGRSNNVKNRNRFFVLAIDSRSATSDKFVCLAVAKLIQNATIARFIPENLANIQIASSFDVLSSKEIQELFSWLKDQDKQLVLIFDQFEDVFRKSNLFKSIYKLMLDVNGQANSFKLGFSWKSEINIPLDNPAYGLWQQARDISKSFKLDEFRSSDIDKVIRQLEQYSNQQLPSELKRRLKESSQGFPWLIKKLSIHCYRQMKKGVSPEELVDQDLKVMDLFQEDMELLTSDQTKVLKIIASRGYNGDPFDITEMDEVASDKVINTLLQERLVIRSGTKYNVYWDIFRDFLVENKVPKLGEGLLFRQYPKLCVKTLMFIIKNAPCGIDVISSHLQLNTGTSLNLVRELRHLGSIIKEGQSYRPKQNINNEEQFRKYIVTRMKEHLVVRELNKTEGEISSIQIKESLKKQIKGFKFEENTWAIYSNFFLSWLKYVKINFGGRLVESDHATSIERFTPQCRPNSDLSILLYFKDKIGVIRRYKKYDKEYYDLKSLGLIKYDKRNIRITPLGKKILLGTKQEIENNIAEIASKVPKIQAAVEILKNSSGNANHQIKEKLENRFKMKLSSSYLKITIAILRSWGNFIISKSLVIGKK